MANGKYPINHHVLAEDFREKRRGDVPYTQDDAQWLMESLVTMCNAYDDVTGKLADVAQTGFLPDGDGVNMPTQMWLEGLVK